MENPCNVNFVAVARNLCDRAAGELAPHIEESDIHDVRCSVLISGEIGGFGESILELAMGAARTESLECN